MRPSATIMLRRGALATLAALALAAGPITRPVAAQTVRSDLDVTNGTVLATAVAGGTLYLGGYFTRIGPSTGCGVTIGSHVEPSSAER